MDVNLMHKIKDAKVLVFGDYMVDEYVSGSVDRISPEAPVPVIRIDNKTRKIGGAGNVVNNITSLGGKVKVMGCIGNDNSGDFIKERLIEKNVDCTYLNQYDEISTITKTRIVSKNQQFLRIDSEKIEPITKEYYNLIEKNIDTIYSDINVLVISDYAKGSVDNKIAQLLIESANKKNIPIVVDPKGKDYQKYRGATLCTPNLKELSDVTGQALKNEKDIAVNGASLCNELGLKYLLLTRSENGISLIDATGTKKDFPAVKKEVVDVSGAGDTVVATVALLLANNYNMEDICKIANFAAGVVVSKFGTATVSLNELICSMSTSVELKYQEIDILKYIIQDLKEKKKKIVFTNGCFDLLHIGHISSFKQAKKLGDVLIVAVNSDKSVKENKGDLRPIISEDDRIEMLCSLEYVDYVVLMDDKDPSKIIEMLQPDICVKGKDWENKFLPEREVIESYGGKVEFLDLKSENSTTSIIEKILKVYEKE